MGLLGSVVSVFTTFVLGPIMEIGVIGEHTRWPVTLNLPSKTSGMFCARGIYAERYH